MPDHRFQPDKLIISDITRGIDERILPIQHKTLQQYCGNIAILQQHRNIGLPIQHRPLLLYCSNIAAMLLQYFCIWVASTEYCSNIINIVVTLQQHCNIAAILLQFSVLLGYINAYEIFCTCITMRDSDYASFFYLLSWVEMDENWVID